MAIDVAKYPRTGHPSTARSASAARTADPDPREGPSSLSTRARLESRLKPRGTSAQALILFTRQLALLLQTGNALVPSIGALATMFRSDTFRVVLRDVHDRMEEGRGFSDALSRHP